MFVVVVHLEIEPGQVAQFMPLMRMQAKASIEGEAECHRFDICVGEDPHQVMLYEIYTDRAAFDAHLKTPHFRDFDTAGAPLMRSKAVTFYTLED